MFYIYQIILWLVLLLFISSKIKRKNNRVLFSIMASFFSTLEISAVYMTERFIDYRFYNHMSLEAIEGYGFQFVLQFVVFIGLFFFLSVSFYFISKKMNTSTLRHNKYFLPAVLISFILLSLPNGIFNETYKIYEILDAEETGFNQALVDLGIEPKEYITPDQLTAVKGKNIIVISIESLEQGFLGENFNGITPNLSRLTNEWTFYNQMPESPGGDWTSASLYNHQVGMPAFFKGQGHEFFRGITDVNLTGLGHVLKKAGYDSKYIIGNAEFEGMSDLLTAYGLSVVSDNNALGKYPKVSNGLNDYDIFQEAKLQIQKNQQDKDKPFALFLSTINTHWPDGIYDKRMEQFISKKEDNLEFSVSAVDYLVNDLLVYLKGNKLLKNTVIYIFPDHKLMGNSGPVIEKLSKSTRQLYLLTNANEKKLQKPTSDQLYQINLPRMIINGAEIKTNAKFLVDFIKKDDVIGFINENKVKLTTLNTASVANKTYQTSIGITIADDNLSIRSDEDYATIPLEQNKDGIFYFSFNTEMALIGHGRSNIEHVFNLSAYEKINKRLYLIVFVQAGKIDKTYLGDKQLLGITKEGAAAYTKEDINLIMESNNITLMEVNRKKQKPVFKYGPLIVSITSSEYITSKVIPSIIKAGGIDFSLSRGLNLLTIDNKSKFHLENFDTYGSQDAAQKFIVRIESLIKDKKFWSIAAHDAIKSNSPGFKEKLSELNFKILQTLNGRMAYIAYSDESGLFQEYSSKTTLSYVISSYRKPLSRKELKLLKQEEKKRHIEANSYRQDTNRFIAHAGGKIEGYTYTDSLEALNLSYKKGFRLFELDIIKTSDDIYVAAHDWKQWSRKTGYTGDLPPDRKTFKEQKIHNKYNLMDMTDINLWFKNHPDAILVTDKVNTPRDFSEKFIDRTRLMMELFTWDAVKEGVSAKIKSAMPTISILSKIKGDKIAYLKKLGITDIASSRRMINGQKTLLKSIVDSGIKIYAFHINFDKGKDEKHVVCAEGDYFYGMYADKWSFNAILDCSKD